MIHMPPSAHAVGHFAKARISHVVVLIQENRTVDNLFNGFCVSSGQCANTVTVDPYKGIKLRSVSLAAPYDLPHGRSGFVTQYDNGKMDGFLQHHCKSTGAYCGPYAFVPASETALYRRMFTVDGVLDDAVLQANQGPSLPAHQYAIAGQAGGYDRDHYDIDDNPHAPRTCETPNDRVRQVNLSGSYPGNDRLLRICKDYPTIFDLVAAAGLNWNYYAAKRRDWWDGPVVIEHLFRSPNIIVPQTQILSDIAAGRLANVAFVTPSHLESDHPGDMTDPKAGERWIASVVNAIGESRYWSDTVIVLYWDDWGGWFDHVIPEFAPDPFNLSKKSPNGYGFRVPYGVISAYARVGEIAHFHCSNVDSLLFIEQVFGLPSLNTLDQFQTGCTAQMLNLSAYPSKFVPL
jgi:phospholipase C